MAKRLLMASLGLIFLMGTVATQVFGADAAAVISSLSGKVEIQRSGEQALQQAKLGDKLFDQDIVYTRKGGRASLLYSGGSLMALSSDNQLSVTPQAEGEKGSGGSSLSKTLMRGLSGLFSAGKKRQTRTIVAGIRKKEEGPARVRVLFPRNTMLLTPAPSFRWKAAGGDGGYTVSLTLKGMKGSLWSIKTGEFEVPFPAGEKPLERGQTYFLRVESDQDPTIADEVYFRVLDKGKAREVEEFEARMADMSKSNPEDMSPAFILAGFYKKTGMSQRALEEVEKLEKARPDERFILEEKAELLAKMGLREEWEAVNRKIESMK